jgi:hypothetical protein
MGTSGLYKRLRDFYIDKKSMDLDIQRLALRAKVPPFSLGVTYEAHGSVVGPATLRRKMAGRDDTTGLSTARVIHPFSTEDWVLVIERSCQGIILVDSDVHSLKYFSDFLIGCIIIPRP